MPTLMLPTDGEPTTKSINVLVFEPDLSRRVVVVETLRDVPGVTVKPVLSFQDVKNLLRDDATTLLVAPHSSIPPHEKNRLAPSRSVYYEEALDPAGLVLALEELLRARTGPLHAPKAKLLEAFLGTSDVICAVREEAKRMADEDVNLLITGPNGSGKNLLASLIHKSGKRRRKPYREVSCPGLPTELVDSELMGVKRGAFTGAITDRAGRLEATEGGTVLLDEIGEITPTTQTKLLHFLESKQVQRVGGLEARGVDVRIIAATNKDLPRAIREKAFREDLYYRIARFHIHLPDLSQRKEDIPLLVVAALNRVLKQRSRVFSIDPKTVKWLQAKTWLGNVRQLMDAVESATIRAWPDTELTKRHFPEAV